MLKELLLILVLASSYPVGLLLAYLTRDELVSGRKWFKAISVLTLVVAIAFLVLYRNYAIILTLIYIVIVSFISLRKSYDKQFVR